MRNRADSRCAFFLVGAMALGVLLDLVRGPHELLCLIILDLLDLRKGDLSALEDFHLAEILQCQLPDCIHGGGGGGGSFLFMCGRVLLGTRRCDSEGSSVALKSMCFSAAYSAI